MSEEAEFDETWDLSIEREFGGTRCPPVMMIVRAAFKTNGRWFYVNRGFTSLSHVDGVVAGALSRGADYVQVFRGDIAWSEDRLERRDNESPICAMCGDRGDTVKPSPRIKHNLCIRCFHQSEALATAGGS